MAKAKAPAWLTTAFAEGVLELAPPRPAPAYKGALGRCWLAQHDERERPCFGPFERFHFIPRQRVEHTLGAVLPVATGQWGELDGERVVEYVDFPRDEIVLLAAWDPRNGGVGCEGHHRRYDSHLTPTLKLHAVALPDHVLDFIFGWGLESEAERRFRQLHPLLERTA
jgi:hypothetical protein